MKFSDLVIGTEYAVIPSWDYSSKQKKDSSLVRRKDVAKAKLVSLDKYDYIVYRSDSPTDALYKPAPKGARSVGYLVESYDWVNQSNSNPVYWLARPQDIVTEYAPLETRWADEERIEEEKRKEYLAQRAQEELLEKQANEYAERIVASCNESLKSILGAHATKIESQVTRRRNSEGNYVPVPAFQLDGRTMQLLIEKILEAQDMVA